MHRHLSILAALMLLTATSLHAAPISIGTSFGYSHFSEASGGGSGLNAFGWPSTNDPLMHLLSPGLRLSLGLDV